jgi:hypothetical protein
MKRSGVEGKPRRFVFNLREFMPMKRSGVEGKPRRFVFNLREFVPVKRSGVEKNPGGLFSTSGRLCQ